MNKTTPFSTLGVIGALCPSCGAQYEEDTLLNNCPALIDSDGSMEDCPHWAASQQDWLDLPCQGCEKAVLTRYRGTRVAFLGDSRLDGKLVFNELHRCACGTEFVVSFCRNDAGEEE